MSKIVSTEDVLGGAPRVEGRRIGVHHIATRVIDAGESPEQVAADYDLDIADVHRALAYYYDHPREMRTIETRQRTVPDGVEVIQPDDFKRPDQPDTQT